LSFYVSDLKVGAVQSRISVLNFENKVSKVVSLERIGGYRVNQLARDILGLIPQFGGRQARACICKVMREGWWNPRDGWRRFIQEIKRYCSNSAFKGLRGLGAF